jgi:hypothetical protein
VAARATQKKNTKIKKNKKIKEIKISVAKTIVFIRFEALGHAKGLVFLMNINGFDVRC